MVEFRFSLSEEGVSCCNLMLSEDPNLFILRCRKIPLGDGETKFIFEEEEEDISSEGVVTLFNSRREEDTRVTYYLLNVRERR